MKIPLNKIWALDIECDALLRDVSVINCAVFTHAYTGTTHVFSNEDTVNTIEKSKEFLLKILNSKDYYITAHNASYDLGVYYKLFGVEILKYADKVVDTAIQSAMMFPKHILINHPMNKNLNDKQLRQSHSLNAWSLRLDPTNTKLDYSGLRKGHYIDTTKVDVETNELRGGVVHKLTESGIRDLKTKYPNIIIREATKTELYDARWSVFDMEQLIKYCKQDVNVTINLLKYFFKESYKVPRSSMAIEVYNSFIASIQTIYGWKIDVEAVERTKQELLMEITKIDIKLSNSFVPVFKKSGESKTLRNSSIWLTVSVDSTPQSVLKTITCPVSYYKNGKPKSKKLTGFKEEGGIYYRKVNIAYVGARSNIELVTFKPNSRSSILHFMKLKYNWIPTMYTESLAPRLDSEVFSKLPYEEAPLLTDRFKLQKSVSQCNTILNNLHLGRVHSNVNVQGTVTGRTTSTKVNLAQIDKKGGFRGFFRPNKDWVMVDADLGGAEIVLLGRYLKPYDNGKMQEIKANKDVHQFNADLAGVSRQDAKPLFFGILYGSSPTLTGYTLWYDGCLDTEVVTDEEYNTTYAKLKRRAIKHNDKTLYPIKKGMYGVLSSLLVYQTIYGAKIQEKLTNGIVGYNELLKELATKVRINKGYFETLDNRRMYSKSSHSNLNYLLQSSNAIYTKYWYYFISEYLLRKGLRLKEDYIPLQSVYDEILHTVKPELLDTMREAYAYGIKACNALLFKNTTTMTHEFQHTLEGWDKIH